MVEMSWTEIQELADQNSLVLLPAGVLEEHGPHLCLGTDIYTAHLHCTFVKEKLEQHGFKVAIGPPFYWGICQSTGGFIGSFQIQKETAKALLLDILAALAQFGFKNIVGINAHGDIEQNVLLLESFKEASERFSIHACYAFAQQILHHYGLTGDEPYLCPIPPQEIKVSASRFADVHAGDIETATMALFYPQLTDVKKARSLAPVALGDDKIWTWLLGGHTQSLSPDGYLGAPADFEAVAVLENIHDIADRTAGAIIQRFQSTNTRDEIASRLGTLKS